MQACKVSSRVGKTLMQVQMKVSQLLLFFSRHKMVMINVVVELFYILKPYYVCVCLEEICDFIFSSVPFEVIM